MRKILLILLAVLAAVVIAALPFLCTHSDILPEVSTAYYEYNAKKEALTATGPEAELMRMLTGLSADTVLEPVATQPEFASFGFVLALGAAVAVTVLILLNRKSIHHAAIAWATALSVPFALIGARLVYCLVNIAFYTKDIAAPEAMLKIWEGGLSLSGALAFIVLAGVIGAKMGKAPVSQMLYALVPGMYALVIAAVSAAKCVHMGYGPEIAESFFSIDIHGTPRLDTSFLVIVLLGVMIIISTLAMQKKNFSAGSRFALYTFLYGTAMILLESLRKDGHMVWGFVHAEMVFDLVFALLGLVYLARTKKRILLSLLFTAIMAGAVVALEFALDRSSIGDGLLYAAYVAVLGVYLAWGCTCAKRRNAV